MVILVVAASAPSTTTATPRHHVGRSTASSSMLSQETANSSAVVSIMNVRAQNSITGAVRIAVATPDANAGSGESRSASLRIGQMETTADWR